MSDTDTQTQETSDQTDNSALRTKLEEALAENKQLRQERRHRAYKDAALPEGAYDVFDSMYDGELTPDALTEFAKAKGFAIGGTGEGEGQPDKGEQRAAGEDRFSQVQSGSMSPREPSTQDLIREAETNGDWQTVDRLNAQLIEQQRAQM